MPFLDTYQASIVKSPATDSTDTSFTSLVPTLTEPTDSATFNLPTNANRVMIYFTGTDAANEAFDALVVGWSKLEGSAGEWIPTRLFLGTVTLGTTTGAANGTIGTSRFFADTISDTYSPDPGIIVASPANDTVAHLDLDARGFDKIQILFDRDTAASAGALVRGY